MRHDKDSARQEDHKYKALAVHLIIAALTTMAFTAAGLSAQAAASHRAIEGRLGQVNVSSPLR
jgi:hypothetical protein